MSRRMRKPETTRLEISQNDWLLVKTHLTAGEMRGVMAGMIRHGVTGDQIDLSKVGLSKVVGYLLDWSIEDADGKPVVIRDQPTPVVEAALDALEPESFAEIRHAIERHEAAMEQVRKNDRDGATVSSATSPSAA